MYYNVDFGSFDGAPALSGAGFWVCVFGLVFVCALLASRRALARAALAACVAVAGLYAAPLPGCSLACSEKVLAAGAEKYFWELDCYLIIGRENSSLHCETRLRLGP